MRVINDPQIVIGPDYAGKTIDLCVDDDLVCDPDGRSFSVHNLYPETGMAAQGATFVVQRLQASWAEDGAAGRPSTPAPAPSSPSPLSAPIAGETTPEHLGSTQQTLPGPPPPPGPAAPAAPPAPVAPLA
jgi:cutinase